MDKYYGDYPKKRIGKGNPYCKCSYCGVSDPEINGRLKGHRPYCAYRKSIELELAKENRDSNLNG